MVAGGRVCAAGIAAFASFLLRLAPTALKIEVNGYGMCAFAQPDRGMWPRPVGASRRAARMRVCRAGIPTGAPFTLRGEML